MELSAALRSFRSNKRLQDVIVAVLFLLMSCIFFNKVFTSDYGIHLTIGRHIVETMKIPDREFLIYPTLNNPVNFEEMGFQVILYTVYRFVGSTGVSVFVWMMSSLAFLFLFQSMRARDINPFVALLTLMILAVPFRIRLQPRPEIFAYFFSSMLIYFCSLFYYKGNRKIIYSIPPIFLLWANIHPSTLAGLGVLGAFGTESLVIALRERRNKQALMNYLCIPGAIFILSALAILISKHGTDSIMTPVNLITNPETRASISEMVSLKNTLFYGYWKFVFALVVISGLACVISLKIKIHDIVMAVYGLKIPFEVARGLAFMSLFSAPLIAQGIDGALKKIRGYCEPPEKAVTPAVKTERDGANTKKRQLSKQGKKQSVPVPVQIPASRYLARTAVLAIWLLLISSAGYGIHRYRADLGEVLENGIGLTEHKFSLKSGEFLRNLDIKGNMFNFFDLGGFIEWQVYPQKHTFIDGRGGPPFADHQAITAALGDVEKMFEKYNITYVVTKTIDSGGNILPLIQYLTMSPNWELVFADGLCVVYVKNIPENKGIMEKYRIPKGTITPQIITELIHSTYLGVNKFYIYTTVGNIYLNGQDYGNALKYLSLAREIHDDPNLAQMVNRLEAMRKAR